MAFLGAQQAARLGLVSELSALRGVSPRSIDCSSKTKAGSEGRERENARDEQINEAARVITGTTFS